MPSREQQRGSGRILLVEDDDSVRAFVSEALRAEGYDVVAEGSPRQALRGQGRFDMLIADVVMPEINGVDLAQRIAPPRVLFISGYDRQARIDGAKFLQKPFTQQQLARKVQEMLLERPAA